MSHIQKLGRLFRCEREGNRKLGRRKTRGEERKRWSKLLPAVQKGKRQTKKELKGGSKRRT